MSLIDIANDRDVTVLKIPLNGWQANEMIAVEGRYLFYAGGTADLTVRFNSPSADPVSFSLYDGIKLPNGFDKVYISSTGTDIITLYIFANVDSKMEKALKSGQNSNILDSHNFTVNTAQAIIWGATSTLKEGVIFNNSSSETVYLGATGVLSTTGLPLAPKSSMSLNSFIGDLYALTVANTADVRVMRVL